MFKNITPEQAGVSSKYVEQFIKFIEKHGIVAHSVLMMKGNDIFAEYYWKPFNSDFCHRMYSQTKSFVSVAIGLLEEEGKLCLDDPISKYFEDRIDRELPTYLKDMTIKEILVMKTCGDTPLWFYNDDPDRTHLYFEKNSAHVPAGTRWKYDSHASQLLSTLVEKLSGMPLFDYMNDRIFKHIGAFKTAHMLKTKNDDTFGDSSMLCTTRDVAAFARFVANYGTWNGKRIMNEEYLRTASSYIVDSDETGFNSIEMKGYGYQIWVTDQNGFAFIGMGGQLTLCIPEKDFIFTITGDNQGFMGAYELIFSALFDFVIDNLESKPLPADENAYKSLCSVGDALELYALKGSAAENISAKINDVKFVCENNPTTITSFSLHFNSDNTGEFRYENAQGKKVLPFGIEHNVISKFPQYGYSTLHAGLPSDDGYLYDSATSACWREKSKLSLKVQIIDEYIGNLLITFNFKDDLVTVTMTKHAEAFMDEYQGEFVAHKE